MKKKNGEKEAFWHTNSSNGKQITSSFDSDDEPQRDLWGSQKEFLLSCIGYTVGLGNIWRFPYLAYQSGGGEYTSLSIFCLYTSLTLFYEVSAICILDDPYTLHIFGKI